MKSIEILALGIRIVGILMIVEIIQYLAYSYTSIHQWMYARPDDSITMWLVYHGVVGSALIVFCFVLLKLPLTVSRWLLPKAKADEPIFSGSIDDLRIAAFMIIGVYILSSAIPDFVHNASMILYLSGEEMMKLYNPNEISEYIIKELDSALKIGIGLYLCLQAKGLNALLLKIRGLGVK